MVLVALAVAVIGMILLGSVLEVPGEVPFAWLLNGLVAVFGLAVAFFPLFYVFPNIDVSVREVIPGVLVAAVGWFGLKQLFNLYVSVSSKPDVYGLLGTLVLMVTWFYVGGLVLLVGAAVNATVAGRNDNRNASGGKRQFGKQVTDEHSFENRLDELVEEAADAGIPADGIEQTLRRRCRTVQTRVTATDDDRGSR